MVLYYFRQWIINVALSTLGFVIAMAFDVYRKSKINTTCSCMANPRQINRLAERFSDMLCACTAVHTACFVTFPTQYYST